MCFFILQMLRVVLSDSSQTRVLCVACSVVATNTKPFKDRVLVWIGIRKVLFFPFNREWWLTRVSKGIVDGTSYTYTPVHRACISSSPSECGTKVFLFRTCCIHDRTVNLNLNRVREVECRVLPVMYAVLSDQTHRSQYTHSGLASRNAVHVPVVSPIHVLTLDPRGVVTY